MGGGGGGTQRQTSPQEIPYVGSKVDTTYSFKKLSAVEAPVAHFCTE